VQEALAALGSARHPSSQRFHDILKKLGVLHDKKQKDYGTDADPFNNIRASAKEWGIPAWVGAMLRATDKVRRLQKFADVGELANESVIDAFEDLAVYAVIARVMYEEEETIVEETNCVCQGCPPFQPCGPGCRYPYTDEPIREGDYGAPGR
jgi:MoaA/NifB/PqqE/SkfB family radical SAM enzyme